MKNGTFTKVAHTEPSSRFLKNQNNVSVQQIRYASLNGAVALQGGERPVLIVQNEIGCIYSPRIWVIPLTTKTEKGKHLPMHVFIPKTSMNGLREDSVALVEQAQFVLKEDIGHLVGYMEDEHMWECGRAFIKNCPMFEPSILRAATGCIS